MTPEILAKIAAARAARGPECLDRNGNCHRTAEKARFTDAVLDWKEAGSPASGAAALEALRAELVAADLW